jgi:phosphonate transport system substrate-binding protein
MMRSRRGFLGGLLFGLGLAISSCWQSADAPQDKLVIGLVSYDGGARSVDRYEKFKEYLSQQTQTFVELEPAYNELNAVEKIERGDWSIAFAPPGLAAIAIDKQQYIPIFPLQGTHNSRAVLVVRHDSSIRTLAHLHDKVVALGEPGSAAGYYLPLYDLYGLTLSEVRFAPTPKTVLEWLDRGEIDAGALSEEEFQRDRHQFETEFRVLHTSRNIPPGLVLLNPNIAPTLRQSIEAAMRDAPPNLVSDTGYLPNVKVLDYQLFIELVGKVRPLERRVQRKPAVLTREGDD